MKKKLTFPEGTCRDCPHYSLVGPPSSETRYCGGFPRKRQKRFGRSDPWTKAPKWCPSRKELRTFRVYRPKEQEASLISLMQLNLQKERSPYAYPSEFRYKLCLEGVTHLRAKDFYTLSTQLPSDQILEAVKLECGDVIELDDGLKPYYFYCRNYGDIAVAPCFHPDKTNTEGR